LTAAHKEVFGPEVSVFDAAKSALMARAIPYVISGTCYVLEPTQQIIDHQCRKGAKVLKLMFSLLDAGSDSS